MKNILIIAFIGLLVSNLSAQDIKIENGLYCKAGVAYTGEASIKDASGAISLIYVTKI